MKKSETKGTLVVAKPAVLPRLAPVAAKKLAAAATVKKDGVLKKEPQTLPEEIVALHKAEGPDGLSNAKFWGDQGWLNLRRVFTRLLETKKKFTEGVYQELFGYQEVPEGYDPTQHLGAVRMEGEVPMVLCALTGTHQADKTPQEFAARWMQWVNDKGELVYIDEANPKLEFTDAAEGRKLKRTGVYTTLVSVLRDGRGKPTAINEKLTGIKIVCGHHQQIVKNRVHVSFLTIADAAVRLDRILNNQKDYIAKGGAINEDLVAVFGEAALRDRKGGNQMAEGFKNAKGGRRSWRK